MLAQWVAGQRENCRVCVRLDLLSSLDDLCAYLGFDVCVECEYVSLGKGAFLAHTKAKENQDDKLHHRTDKHANST